jgi:hypothetical protein
MVSFTLRPLYPRRKSPWYTLDRRLCGHQRLSGRRAGNKILDPTGTRTPTPLSSSLFPVAISIALSRLLMFINMVVFEHRALLVPLPNPNLKDQPLCVCGRIQDTSIYSPFLEADSSIHKLRPRDSVVTVIVQYRPYLTFTVRLVASRRRNTAVVD